MYLTDNHESCADVRNLVYVIELFVPSLKEAYDFLKISSILIVARLKPLLRQCTCTMKIDKLLQLMVLFVITIQTGKCFVVYLKEIS